MASTFIAPNELIAANTVEALARSAATTASNTAIANAIAAIAPVPMSYGQSGFLSGMAAKAQREMAASSPISPICSNTAATAMAVYGMCKLVTAYAGACINVVRASDSAALDIGFTPDGRVDIAAMQAFGAGTSLVCATWYDQSGSANHAVVAANRPSIGWNYPKNGMPYVLGNGTSVVTLPAGVAITNRQACSVWTACRAITNEVTYNPWILGTATFIEPYSYVSHYSMQIGTDASTYNCTDANSFLCQNGSVFGVNVATGTASVSVGAVTQAASGTITSGACTAGQFPGGSTSSEIAYWALIIYNSTLVANDVNIMKMGLANNFNLNMNSQLGTLVISGDSTLIGVVGGDYNYTSELTKYIPSDYLVYAFGKSGENATWSSNYFPLYNANRQCVYVITGGVNDIRVSGVSAATLEATYTSFAAAVLAAGFIPGIVTIPRAVVGQGSYTQALENTRAAVQAWTVANGGPGKMFPVCVNMANEPRMNPWTYPFMSSDNLHPNAITYQMVSGIWAEGIVPALLL